MPLIVTDSRFSKTGLLDVPAASLRAANISVQLYSGVLSKPTKVLILQAVAQVQQHPVDIVIGGGSSMDIAKLIAAGSKSCPACMEPALYNQSVYH